MRAPLWGAAILGLAIVIAGYLIGGRFTLSTALTFDGTTSGVIIVNRFTGSASYCLVHPPTEACRPLPQSN
jgi:hypothetical protein